ncbi:Plasmid stabilization system protein ParE [Aquiflexum balticum DSM 16537]|uniref:Plasmid stabilization system protein ParE n=1 Tax=Aquiflexum balticum DSM 16537 TaxID=758820 RepID=A0A1W2H5N8_9BACT|nr:type II toxin-antitoxin system RelE/ParE family toxin [Aquiflexum balticum]SMD43928.1 Plasmid stabilization system protein ParE [Aquiflexum balticum DSM 16537]
MKAKKVIWSKKAVESLKYYHDFIKKDSPSAAIKVKQEIINASKSLATDPEKYQLDEFIPNNPGNIRRFFRWSYRIVYQVNFNSIDILNVIHTSQEPEK